MAITNPTLATYPFLEEMLEDSYFPDHLVRKGIEILHGLCEQIEAESPADLDALYVLTHAATDAFNDLAEEFEEADSEIETAARENIGRDVAAIAAGYGFADADIEELIATRDW